MVSEEGIKRVFVGKKIIVQDKNQDRKFEVVDARIDRGRVIFRVNCEGLPPDITMNMDAKASEDEYLELYQLMAEQARRQPRRTGETGEVGEGKVKPALKFVQNPLEMIGKAVNVKPNKYGITKENADKAYISVLNLEDEIKGQKIGKIVRKIRIREGDAPPPNIYVSRRMNIMEVIEYAKRAHKGLDFIWGDYERRVKSMIRVLKTERGSYSAKLGTNGFKKPEEARFLYAELRKLPPQKLRSIFRIKGRVTNEVRKGIEKKILNYQKKDKTWMYHWNLLAIAVHLINDKLIPRISEAVAQQGQT